MYEPRNNGNQRGIIRSVWHELRYLSHAKPEMSCNAVVCRQLCSDMIQAQADWHIALHQEYKAGRQAVQLISRCDDLMLQASPETGSSTAVAALSSHQARQQIQWAASQ